MVDEEPDLPYLLELEVVPEGKLPFIPRISYSDDLFTPTIVNGICKTLVAFRKVACELRRGKAAFSLWKPQP
jgi:hypothetical protein